MECLNGRIGIRGVTGQTPDPALYINDLPGITLENITALASTDDAWLLDVWRRVKLSASKKFSLMLRAELTKCCKLSSTVISCLVCNSIENEGLFDVALWYLHGVELMIERTSSDTMNRWTTIDLDKAERLKGDFYAEFQTALQDAVKSIDVNDSLCIEECLDSNELIKFEYNLP
jgi:hypothetical protein